VQERSIQPKKEFDLRKHIRMVPPLHEAEVDNKCCYESEMTRTDVAHVTPEYSDRQNTGGVISSSTS